MSKKKKIILVVAILLAIIVSFLGGQTFSKYVTEVTGKANAEVANWHFVVNQNEAQTQNINLASTINNETLVDNKIAPGTKGEFKITVDGTGSDVGIQYDIEIKNETQKPQNLFFTYEGQKYKEISQIFNITSGAINANAEDKVREILVKWEWPYELGGSEQEKSESNGKDTTDGTTLQNYSFDVVVTGKQVEPYAA